MSAPRRGAPKGGMIREEQGSENTLRMSHAEVERLRKENDAPQAQRGQREALIRRTHYRWPFPQKTISVELTHPGGTTTRLNYACRDLSAGGMSVFHSAYTHVGTRITAMLPCADGSVLPVPGVVVRCRHYRGKVHEIGVKFIEPIDVREVLKLDPFEGAFTLERVPAERLEGTVLLIEDSELDRRLIRHHLRDTNLHVVTAEDGATALGRAHEVYDLIICDFDLPDINGPDLILRLRETGVTTPVIMVSADWSAEARATARPIMGIAGASTFLAKPISEQRLLQAIAEFLLLGSTGGEAGPLISTLAKDAPERDFVPEFVQQLQKLAGDLNRAIVEDDVAACRRSCFQLKGSAPALGFEIIGLAADAALTQLNASMSIAESIGQLRQLISACLRARADAER